MHQCIIGTKLILLLELLIYAKSNNQFQFKEFDYMESPKNEIAWREWEAACQQNPICIGLDFMEKIKCTRKCISSSCYNDIYAFDELEEGEIDIRFQSFKGCFVQRIARRRV